MLVAQFTSPVIWLLLAACPVSAALGETADAIAIASIIVINGFVGFFQEYPAGRAVMALRAMTAPRGRVVRNGRVQVRSAACIVPEDLMVLEAGDVVAADARLVEAHELSTMEAALTGESTPVTKSTRAMSLDTALAERTDCVFSGTSAATGSGLAKVCATGMQIELGRIASLLNAVTDETTPLQRRLAALSRRLMVICTDKTGTLTTGAIAVREIWGIEHRRVLEVVAADRGFRRAATVACRPSAPSSS